MADYTTPSQKLLINLYVQITLEAYKVILVRSAQQLYNIDCCYRTIIQWTFGCVTLQQHPCKRNRVARHWWQHLLKKKSTNSLAIHMHLLYSS